MTPIRTLHLADDLNLPLDAVTQTFLIVGKRGSGKSNTAARFVEQLHRARLPFVVLDPVDTWWGLKAARDGGRGLDVYVFGGSHKDLPLEPGAGALLADVLCEHRMPMVLSVKHLSGRERSAFMVAFAQTLFRKWSGGPLHVVLEEAHELAPQMAGRGGGNEDNEAAMLGAFKRLWKLGRASGIGGTAVTQRPASLSKDITTQSEILIAHRTIGPQDVKAIGEWVKYHGEHEDILKDLPTLPTGEAFIWAPEFPEGKPIGLRRATVYLRETYDSASTPKVGEQRVEPKELAPVDLARIEKQMAATIEKAKADDPRELRKQIAELKKQVSEAAHNMHAKGQPRVETKTVDRFVLKDGQIARVEKLVERIASVIASTSPLLEQLHQANAAIVGAIGKTRSPDVKVSTTPSHRPPLRPRPSPVVPTRSLSQDAKPLAPGERRILTAVAQFGEVDRGQLTVLVGYKATARDTYISRLAQKGLVESGQGRVRVTADGITALGSDYEPLPTGEALLDYWRGRLPVGEVKVLNAIVAAHPDSISRDVLGEVVGYKPTARDTYISRLASRRLVQSDGRGTVRASAELFS